MVEEIIKNDFVDFLDKQHHLTISSTSSDHILYKKIFGITSIFNHHDLCNADSFQRYIRCIERFRELKTSSTRTIFIMVDSSIDPEFAHSLGNQLTQAFSSFTLFVKHNQSSGSMLLPQARLLNCDANHSLIEFVHLGGLAAVTFEREVDDLCLATLVLDEIVSHLD